MNKFFGMIGAAVFSILMVSGASAATVICEGGGPGPENGDGACTNTLGDFSNATGTPSFDLSGDTEFRGGVAATFADGWTVNLGSADYKISVSVTTVGNTDFDGVFTIGGQGGSTFNVGPNTTVTLAGLFSGSRTLLLDADAGQARWEVNLTAVPLPASGLMLLAALGAAGFASRRKKS